MISNLSLTINSTIGLGDLNLIEDPKVKNMLNGYKEYTIEMR